MRSLSSEQCDAIWDRIQAKKYAYGFGRDSRFINRCYLIQYRLSDIRTLSRFAEKYDIHATCVIEANTIYLKRYLGEIHGSTNK